MPFRLQLLAIILYAIRGVTGAAEPEWTKTPADAWPLFRGNALSTGVATSMLPERPELLWKYSVANGAFDATAAIVAGTVYIGDLDGTVYALALTDGKELWKFKNDAGFSAAPAVRDGVVYIGDQNGMFYALDAKEGKQLWKYEAAGQIYGANFHQEFVVFGAQDGTLHCLKAKTGEFAWKFQIEDQIRCTPTISDGNAFLVGCDGKLHVIDVVKGKESGTVPIESPAGTTAAAAGDRIYFGTSSGKFLAIDWKNSKLLWSYQDKARQQPISGSAALTDKLVIVPGEDRTLRTFEPLTGKSVWKKTLKGKLESSPVIVGERVFIGGNDGRLHAFSLETGDPLWNYETGGKLISSPAVASERLVIASDDGHVYCFGAK